ncbi:MAG: homocysteine S-methyltransferase family protein [Bauldia litoralis]|uniref:homocysteine S-methyltransferase family protein n=2 Tax=Bauldia litoralis TaxID=665467 RepID=UPI0032994EE6
MAKYRAHLPQISGDEIFLTDGGLETFLIFQENIDLPYFAAFDLMKNDVGRDMLRAYYRPFAEMAVDTGLGYVLESPTWRASPDWGARLGYSDRATVAMNHEAIALMQELRRDFETPSTPMVISGCVGPRGDGYVADNAMTAEQAEHYHAPQIHAFRRADADMVTAVTMNYANEAIGIARAAAKADMPVVISFTVETDGRLPTGQTLKDAISTVDLATGSAPTYYMINCAHPTHFDDIFDGDATWIQRIQGLRANASTMSHAELDNATELDDGDPRDLGERYAELRRKQPQLTVMGGCCGTDHRHVREICLACMAVA